MYLPTGSFTQPFDFPPAAARQPFSGPGFQFQHQASAPISRSSSSFYDSDYGFSQPQGSFGGSFGGGFGACVPQPYCPPGYPSPGFGGSVGGGFFGGIIQRRTPAQQSGHRTQIANNNVNQTRSEANNVNNIPIYINIQNNPTNTFNPSMTMPGGWGQPPAPAPAHVPAPPPINLYNYNWNQNLNPNYNQNVNGNTNGNGSGSGSGFPVDCYYPPIDCPTGTIPTPCPPPSGGSKLVKGSAGMYYDNTAALYSDIPTPANYPRTFTLKPTGDKPVIFSDPDEKLDVALVQNPTGQIGVAQEIIRVGSNRAAIFSNDGSLTVVDNNGNKLYQGNLADAQNLGFDLGNGVKVGSKQLLDNVVNGQPVFAERFFLESNEYLMSAGVRSNATGKHLDLNFEEKTDTAANNATGYKDPASGLTLADYLKLERS